MMAYDRATEAARKLTKTAAFFDHGYKKTIGENVCSHHQPSRQPHAASLASPGETIGVNIAWC
jgi:hypothetical protein